MQSAANPTKIECKKESYIMGPGTNYSNISHESKTERSSEADIWAMDASDWMILLK